MTRKVRLEWDVDDAEEVADIFDRAAAPAVPGGRRDEGWAEDAAEIRRQIDALRAEESPNPG